LLQHLSLRHHPPSSQHSQLIIHHFVRPKMVFSFTFSTAPAPNLPTNTLQHCHHHFNTDTARSLPLLNSTDDGFHPTLILHDAFTH
jgi:hypothetical protein